MRHLVIILARQFWREIGRKSDGQRAASCLGKRTKYARLMRVKSIDPLWKSAKASTTSADMTPHKVEKKQGPKPSGPRMESLFIRERALAISLEEKASVRVEGRVLTVGYKSRRLKFQWQVEVVPRRVLKKP